MISLILNVVGLLSGIFVIVWYRRHHRPVWRSLGLTANRWTLPDIAVGLVVPFVAITLVFLVEQALGAIEVTGGADDWSGIAGVIGQVLGFALIEEIVFRVFMLGALVILLRRIPAGRWIAVGSAALVFGSAHLANDGATLIGAFGTALGGVIYGIAYLATRTIWLPLFLHVSWNLSQALWGFPVSGLTEWPGWVTSTSIGDELLNGGAYGPEGGIPGMLARVLIVALVFVYLKLLWPDGSIRRLEFAPDPVRRARSEGRAVTAS
ncbi:hypothetical protein SAMN05428970_2561 [Agromyces sp. CF514]|uniref:CPBP family intramembrane glutamic endopeptidase n=1 Tax=Agromyces sp. CF514 TaxID=1881031 RepID=UPI0008E8C387|nr:CPBP family intramembrane glutamic endopeptidase [Agromyces sp. CF514]SFR79474.1 hypothetical protein SAMN05428970_2561 [Agromyces sp. CF514]